MKDRDLPGLLHAWVIHGSPDEALDGSDREFRITNNGSPIRSERTEKYDVGGKIEMSEFEPAYVSLTPGSGGRRRNSRTLVAVAAAAIALTGGTVIFAASRSTAPELVASAPEGGTPRLPTAAWTAGPCGGPVVRGPKSERSTEQEAAAEQESKNLDDEIARTGFGFYSAPTQTGGWVCGWAPVGIGINGAKAIIEDKGGEAVFDAPRADAGILGYNFADLGFFSVEEVQAPTFDPGQLRVQRYGCDTLTTDWCRSPETILGNGQPPQYQHG